MSTRFYRWMGHLSKYVSCRFLDCFLWWWHCYCSSIPLWFCFVVCAWMLLLLCLSLACVCISRNEPGTRSLRTKLSIIMQNKFEYTAKKYIYVLNDNKIINEPLNINSFEICTLDSNKTWIISIIQYKLSVFYKHNIFKLNNYISFWKVI